MQRKQGIALSAICLLLSTFGIAQSKTPAPAPKTGVAHSKAAVPKDAGRALNRVDNKAYFIDRNGQIPFQCRCDDAIEFQDGMAVIYRGSKAGYIDRSGREVIRPQFSSAESFSEGLATV